MPLLFGQQLLRAFRRLGWYADDADAQQWIQPGGLVIPTDMEGWQFQTAVVNTAANPLPSSDWSLLLLNTRLVDPVRLLRVVLVLSKPQSSSWAGAVDLRMNLQDPTVPGLLPYCQLTPRYDLSKLESESIDDQLFLSWQPPSECWISGGGTIFADGANAMPVGMEVLGQVAYNRYPGGAS